ncbi:hypothetical protein Btru_045267 [Bulinus truncatus]|nr:hypothetical protein Btru_045267 [Bulinus truncatus]
MDLSSQYLPTRCQLPPDSGLCFGYFLMYFYNSTSQNCQEFVYGGCGGNANRFETVAECRRACSRRQ